MKLTEKITIDESNLADATKYEYSHRIKQFYKYAPIKSDEELIQCPIDELQEILVGYTRYLVKKVNSGKLNPNTVPKMFRGIRWVLNSNYRENDIKWKPIESIFPKTIKRSGYKPWTTENIASMLEKTRDARNKALLHFQASTGGRIGIHDHALQYKHLELMSWNGHSCYAVLLYADEDETIEEKDLRDRQDNGMSGDSYWAFLTPEATDYLDKYFEERLLHGERMQPHSPIFRRYSKHGDYSTGINQISDKAVSQIIARAVKSANLNRIKKGTRYDTQLNHGFRKRFNTIMKLELTVNPNIAEKILGHKNGLDGTYLKPTRDQCFAEFVKGITALTISDSKRANLKITALKKEMESMDNLKARISLLENEKDSMVREAQSDTEKINIEDLSPELQELLKKLNKKIKKE